MSSFHNNYFENIDAVDKAYWLGFIYADGSVKKNRLTIELSKKDEERLNQFLIDANIDMIISHNHKKLNYKNEIRIYPSVKISFIDKKMYNDLLKIGCIENKTFRMTLPRLSSELLYDAFLLGYYDGDGFEKRHKICSGNKDFLLEIKNKYNIEYDVKLKKHTNKKWKCYEMTIGWDLHSRILKSYEKSMPRKRKFLSRVESKEKAKRNRKLKFVCISLEDMNISKEQLQELVNKQGLKIISDTYKMSEKTLKRICEYNNIKLFSIQERNTQQRRFNISKEELEKLVQEKPLLQIGKIFGVSDNAIRKRCKRFGIELPKKVWNTSIENLKKRKK